MTKMKITHHRVIGNGCIHLGIGTCVQCQSISQSVFYQVLNAVIDGAFKRKCLKDRGTCGHGEKAHAD